jgi:hypothetical protein
MECPGLLRGISMAITIHGVITMSIGCTWNDHTCTHTQTNIKVKSKFLTSIKLKKNENCGQHNLIHKFDSDMYDTCIPWYFVYEIEHNAICRLFHKLMYMTYPAYLHIIYAIGVKIYKIYVYALYSMYKRCNSFRVF